MNEDNIISCVVLECDSGNRIDKFLCDQNINLSRSYIQKLIKDEAIMINNKHVKASYKVTVGETIFVKVPPLIQPDIEPENIPLEILYEDNDIIVINKGKNMVVHPAAGHYSGTLVNALMYHCKGNLSGINGIMRPGIVHRIDQNTTGAIIACKNDFSHNYVANQLKEHSITRYYYAIVHGKFSEQTGTVDKPIGRHTTDRKKMAVNIKNGKHAITYYEVIESFGNDYTLVKCKLETGRTHQIRVHMASIHHPLLGDDVYGHSKSPFNLNGQVLHASILGLIHPSTSDYIEFEAPFPDYFINLIEKLRNKYKN